MYFYIGHLNRNFKSMKKMLNVFFLLFKVCHVEYTTWAESIWKAARSVGQDNARRVDIS